MSVGSIRKLNPKLPDSPWVYEYTDPDTRKRIRRTTKTGKKKDAQALQAKISAELFAGSHTPVSRTISIDHLCTEYHEHLRRRHLERRGAGATHVRNCLYAINLAIAPVIGQIKVSELTFLDVERVAKAMADKGRHPSTIQMRLQLLKQIVEYGIRRGYAKENPVIRVIKDRGHSERVPIRQFGFEEIGSLFKALETRPAIYRELQWDRMKIFVHSAATMGLRFGEILGLTVGAIDLKSATLHVRHSMTSMDELKGPKTKSGIRDLAIPGHVVAMLREWLAIHYVDNDRGLLFKPPKLGQGRRSTNLTTFNFNGAWKRLLTLAGLPPDEKEGNYHFHALRHFHSSYLIHKGVPVTDIAEIMGHRYFDVTLQVYAHPITSRRERHDQMQRLTDDLLAMREIARPAPLVLSCDVPA